MFKHNAAHNRAAIDAAEIGEMMMGNESKKDEANAAVAAPVEGLVMCDPGKEKHDVYGIVINGSRHLFSDGVSREFGENKLVFVEGHQILASVQPLHTTDGLKCIGHLYT